MSLTEILVVTVIILVIASISSGVYIKAREQSDIAACLGNLRALSQAAQLYLNENASLPSDMMPVGTTLSSHGLSADRIVCPSDQVSGTTDSYSRFFIRRRKFEPDDRIIASCGRHKSGTKSILLRMDGTTPIVDNLDVEYNNLSATRDSYAGDTFGEGFLRTADGVEIEVTSISKILSLGSPGIKSDAPMLLSSFTQGATSKIILYLPANYLAKFTITSSAETSVEVITDAINAEISNGQGIVNITTEALNVSARVENVSAEVTFAERRNDRANDLLTGSGRSVKIPISELETLFGQL